MKMAPGAPVVAVMLLDTVVSGEAAELPMLPVLELTVSVGAVNVPAVTVILPEPLAITEADVVPVALAPKVTLPLLAVVVKERVPVEMTPLVVIELLSETLS